MDEASANPAKIAKMRDMLPLWILLALCIVADAIGLHIAGLSLDPAALHGSILKFIALLALFLISRRLKLAAWLINFLHIATIIWGFMAVTLVMSYIGQASGNRPFIDPALVTADHILGFDWNDLYQWVKNRSPLHTILILAYDSFVPQMIVIQFVLSWRSHPERGRELALLSVVSCIICIVLSSIWPALGPFSYFHAQGDAPHIANVLALRDGSMKIIGSRPVQGLIEFPSFHTAMAILYTYAARGIPDLFPALLILNALMLVATLPIGGHYLADVWSGAFITLIIIGISRKACKKQIID